MVDDDGKLTPLHVVTFDIVGERQNDLWRDLKRLASDHGIELKYRRSRGRHLEVVLHSDGREAVDAWAASVASFASCTLIDVTFLPVLRWRVLMRVPEDRREEYRDFIVSVYPTGEMDLLLDVEEDIPEDLDVWYFRTADRHSLSNLFEESCPNVSGSVVAIEEFPETAEERDAGDKVALHAQLISQWIPAQEQALAHLLVALIQDHIDGQDWQSMGEELADKAGLLVLGFPGLLGDITGTDDPGATLAKQLIARCRAIVEQPSGPWRDVLARLPRATC